jgi:hypothetical protein
MQVPGGLLICVLLLCYHMACRTLVTACTSRDKGSSAVARLLEQYISFCLGNQIVFAKKLLTSLHIEHSNIDSLWVVLL